MLLRNVFLIESLNENKYVIIFKYSMNIIIFSVSLELISNPTLQHTSASDSL